MSSYTFIHFNVIVNCFFYIVELDKFVIAMGDKDGARSADGFTLETGEVRGVAAEGNRLTLEAFGYIVFTRSIAAESLDLYTWSAPFHPLLNQRITRESSAEI